MVVQSLLCLGTYLFGRSRERIELTRVLRQLAVDCLSCEIRLWCNLDLHLAWGYFIHAHVRDLSISDLSPRSQEQALQEAYRDRSLACTLLYRFDLWHLEDKLWEELVTVDCFHWVLLNFTNFSPALGYPSVIDDGQLEGNRSEELGHPRWQADWRYYQDRAVGLVGFVCTRRCYDLGRKLR